MQELTEILGTATASIAGDYFHLNIDGGTPVYRERVYCYELYHQMRKQWPRNTRYRLNGEVDKAAHPILTRRGAAGVKPDLLVHRPGDMNYNHAVIEVKASPSKAEEIRKDLTNLSKFCNDVGYQRAMYLFYGTRSDAKLVRRVQRFARDIMDLAVIELWLHRVVGQPAECVLVIEPRGP